MIRSHSRTFKPFICSSCAESLKLRARKLATAASPDIYDVVCVGGGPAGLSLLAALRSQENASRLRLALVESQDLDHARSWHLPPDQYSNRASSLTPTSLSFLSQIGAWHLVDDSRVQAYHHMRVWDGLSSNSRISFDSPFSDHPIAYMTENQNLTKGLARRLDELSDISMFDKTNVEKISLGAPPSSESSSLNLSSYPHVTLSSKHTIAARLLVGADGNNSPVRKFAGIDTRGWDYNRHGIVATLKLSNGNKSDQALPRRRTAYQRFLPTGPVALLALPGDYATLVWTATPAQAAHLKSLSENDFIAMVNAAFRLQIVDLDFMFTIPSGQVDELLWRESVSPSTIAEENGEIPSTIESVQEGSRASFPLRLRQSKTYTTDRVALIGDAAHTIHPLAGQGLNMGLGDAKSLASSIDFAVKHGADIGNEISCLDQYNSDTWMSNNRMLGAVDKLHWLCAMKSSPVVGLRGLGLRVVDSLEPLKGWFMRQAGGL